MKTRVLFVCLFVALSIPFAVANDSQQSDCQTSSAQATPAEAPAPTQHQPANATPRELPGKPGVTPATDPPCPSTHTCAGGFKNCNGPGRPCGIVGGEINDTNTGYTSCDNSGTPFTCTGGKTVHVIEWACGQCPCCSTTPFPTCFCPDNCGTHTSLECR